MLLDLKLYYPSKQGMFSKHSLKVMSKRSSSKLFVKMCFVHNDECAKALREFCRKTAAEV